MWRQASVALLVALVACEKKMPLETAAPADAASPSKKETVDAGATAEVDAAVDAGTVAWDCSDTSPPKTGKSIGHTSVVFKLELANGKKVAWKPNAKKVRGRYKGEIAAYRLAQALDLPNVPAACLRVFDRSTVASALATNPAAAKLFAEEAIDEDGKIYGVVIPWIEGLTFWPLEKDPLRSDARTWLTAGKEIPADKRSFAEQTSKLVAFDFITGNWDRYSGANVGLDATGTRVLFIDNDAAFMELPPKDALAKNKALLDATDRFSRSFVEHLRTLDLGAALGDEGAGRPLLSKAAMATVSRRIKELLAVVEAKIKAHGEAETLTFP